MNQEFKPTHTSPIYGRLQKLSNARDLMNRLAYIGEDITFRLLRDNMTHPIFEQLTPIQMLEAAEAKGIKWTLEWPKESGWHCCDFAGRAEVLRWVDVNKRTVSAPVFYVGNEIEAGCRAAEISWLDNSLIFFAKPWWVQS